jgi:hypothetical protein
VTSTRTTEGSQTWKESHAVPPPESTETLDATPPPVRVVRKMSSRTAPELRLWQVHTRSEAPVILLGAYEYAVVWTRFGSYTRVGVDHAPSADADCAPPNRERASRSMAALAAARAERFFRWCGDVIVVVLSVGRPPWVRSIQHE